MRPFPGPGQKRLVSSDGGTEPRWRHDGRELLYRRGDAIMAVDVTLSPSFSASIPRVLFTGPYSSDSWSPTWDVLPDARQFVMIQDFAQPRTAVTLVQNWFTELRQKLATTR